MTQLTIYLARSIGLFTVLLVAGFLVRGGAAIETTVADGPVMISYAIISLAMGVAMVVGHNVWSGGAVPVVVTMVGWLILAKGLRASGSFPGGAYWHGSPDAIRRSLSSLSRACAGGRTLPDLGRLRFACSAGTLIARGIAQVLPQGYAARTLSRNFSTSSRRWVLTSDNALADFSI